jgi:hypothetical protein
MIGIALQIEALFLFDCQAMGTKRYPRDAG